MAEQNKPQNLPSGVQINYDETPTKAPPVFDTGVFAWVRKNLFSTPIDAFITIGGTLFIISLLISFLSWTIGDANWFAITFNFRQFMVGRYDFSEEWRLILLTWLIAFTSGAAIAAYTRRLSAGLLVIIAFTVLPVFLLPPAARILLPQEITNQTVSNAPLQSGTQTENTIPALAFIAKADQAVVFRFEDQIETDEQLGQLSGFMDDATNLLRVAANNRRDDIERIIELERLLRDPSVLTPNQQDQLASELDRLVSEPEDEADQARLEEIEAQLAASTEASSEDDAENVLSDAEVLALMEESALLQVPSPITERYSLNEQPVELRILDRDGEPIASVQTLEPGGDPVRFTIPADGWYILEKSATTEADTTAILAIEGFYPVYERSSEYQLITETDFRVAEPIPERDGDPLPYNVIIENQYWGSRDLGAYLRVYLAPFFALLTPGTLQLLILGALGYAAMRFLDRRYSSQDKPRKTSQQTANYLLISIPFLMYILINGLDLRSFSALVAWFAFTAFAYYLGVFFGRRFSDDKKVEGGASPVVGRLVATIAVWVVGSFMFGFMPNLTFGFDPLPFIIGAGLMLPSAVMFYYGTDQVSVERQVMSRNLLITGSLTAVFYLIPVIYFALNLPADEESLVKLIYTTDARRWGGLLLALVITVWGTIIAFPVGIGLALGRRSNLPAIKYLCTIIIEVVRGTPFIVVLFAGQLLVPLINPAFADIPNVYRALASTIIFIGAYLAENVRGGLQSIPPGQEEAARALGLAGWQVTLFILLPQALRAVIPALVGQFISLFKDTSLLAIVGLIDLTGFVNSMVAQPEFQGTRREGLLFISIIYFAISYIMSYVSRRLEESGSGSARRM